VKAVAAPSLKLDDLNKLLASGSESESSEGPPAHLANLSGDRPAQVLFVVVMDEWVRSLPNEDFLPLIKCVVVFFFFFFFFFFFLGLFGSC
jgi:hypothetical protein